MNLSIALQLALATKEKSDLKDALRQLEHYYQVELVTKQTYDTVKTELVKLINDTDSE